jgi:hypothetical protein
MALKMGLKKSRGSLYLQGFAGCCAYSWAYTELVIRVYRIGNTRIQNW